MTKPESSAEVDSGHIAGTPWRGRGRIVFLLLVAVYIGTRLWRLSVFSVDYEDEYFSILAARSGLSELLRAVAADIVHPPLFYILLKPWIALGGIGNLWLGSFPLLLSVATLWPFLGLSRALGLRPSERNLALALLAGSWYLMFFADFLRMYALLQFLSVCSLWVFVRYLQTETNRGRWLVALTGVNLLLIYSHYYGWLVVGAELAWVLFTERRRLMAFSASVGALALCFLPWALAVISAMASVQKEMEVHLGWLSRPGLNSHLLHFYNQVSGFQEFPRSGFLWIALFLLPIAWWGISTVARRRDPEVEAGRFWFLACFAFLPAIAAFLVSQLLPASVWHPRHLVITVVPYAMLVSVAVLRLRPRVLAVATVVLVVAWTATAAVQHARDYRLLDWEGLANAVIEREPAPRRAAPFYVSNVFDGLLLQFYLRREAGDGFKVQFVCLRCPQPSKNTDIAIGRDLDFRVVDEWTALSEERMWVLFSSADFAEMPDPVTVLTGSGYRETRRLRFDSPYRTVEAVQLERE